MVASPVSRTLHAGECKVFSLCKLKPLQKFTFQHAVISDNISEKNFPSHNWARCMHNFINIYGQRHLSGLATSILNALCITFLQPFCSEWIISLLLKLDAMIKIPVQLPLTSFFWDKIGTIWHYAIYWNVQIIISFPFQCWWSDSEHSWEPDHLLEPSFSEALVIHSNSMKFLTEALSAA